MASRTCCAEPPEEEGKAKGGEGHHSEGCPVQEVSGELPLVVPNGDGRKTGLSAPRSSLSLPEYVTSAAVKLKVDGNEKLGRSGRTL
jgi:hypothetical protein